MSQITEISEHLLQGKSLTALDAFYNFQCMNLKGRIWDLKQMGLKIGKKHIKTNTNKTVASYFLTEFPQKAIL